MTEAARCLREALALTRAALAAVVTTEDVARLMDERAIWLERAHAARDGGERCGEDEAHVAAQILEADKAMLEALWRPRADAFDWMIERAPDTAAEMPSLSALRESLR